MSRSPQFQVDGQWFPFTVEDESPIVAAQREAHLREAKEREAIKFRCKVCGEAGALAKGGDRYHGPGICDARKVGEAEAYEWWEGQQRGGAA